MRRQFNLRTFNDNGQQTFEQKFYISSTEELANYLLELSEKIKEFNFDISIDTCSITIDGGRNHNERKVVIEAINNNGKN